MAIEIGDIEEGDIREYAEEFLAEYHPGGAIPVPIEEIIEFGMGIELRPILDAQQRFGFEAALTYDLETVLYDERLARKFMNRYRYTLAHEAAHVVLHADLIRSLAITDKQQWKDALKQISPRAYSLIEKQAYVFAEYALVPNAPLETAFRQAVQRATNSGIDLSEVGEAAVGFVAGWIAKQFDVSTAVIEHRIKREGLHF